MPRGGRRSGKPGQAYPNRSDLPTAPDPGAGTFKGQPYGAGAAQAQVQAAGSQPGPGGPAPMAAPSGPAPGAFGAFNRPSERPDEPITHGLPTGPGAGPEILGNAVGNPEDADLRDMAVYIPVLEHLAGMPGSSIATRNFVRRLKGMTPPEVQNGITGPTS